MNNTLKNKVESLGGTLYEDDSAYICDAPRGHVWVASDCTTITIVKTCFGARVLKETMKQGMQELSYGKRICTPEEVESISHELDEDWSLPK